jgi:hypothetical protein
VFEVGYLMLYSIQMDLQLNEEIYYIKELNFAMNPWALNILQINWEILSQ